MTSNTKTTDLVESILGAAFGPTIAAEVAKEAEAEGGHPSSPVEGGHPSSPVEGGHPSSPEGADGTSLPLAKVEATPPADAGGGNSDLPPWWKYNLDGSPRKRVQAVEICGGGSGSGEAKRFETDRAILAALHAGAETLAQLVAATGFVKVTVVRSVERLEASGRVVKGKADPTGRRGRRAFVFRPTTEPVAALAEVPQGGVDLRSTVEPATSTSSVPADGHEATE